MLACNSEEVKLFLGNTFLFRETYKREYEERMKRELEELSARTNNELNKIKESTTEMYERENRYFLTG